MMGSTSYVIILMILLLSLKMVLAQINTYEYQHIQTSTHGWVVLDI